MNDIVDFGKHLFSVIGVEKFKMFRPVRLAKFTAAGYLLRLLLINYRIPSCCMYNGIAALYVYSDVRRVLAYKKQTKQAAGTYRGPA